MVSPAMAVFHCNAVVRDAGAGLRPPENTIPPAVVKFPAPIPPWIAPGRAVSAAQELPVNLSQAAVFPGAAVPPPRTKANVLVPAAAVSFLGALIAPVAAQEVSSHKNQVLIIPG